jgi:hypothetical protein
VVATVARVPKYPIFTVLKGAEPGVPVVTRVNPDSPLSFAVHARLFAKGVGKVRVNIIPDVGVIPEAPVVTPT